MIRIVVVEDEPHSANLLRNMLEKYCTGASVAAVAHSVSDAIAEIKKHKPDVVFLDVELGDGSGFEVLENFPNPAFSIVFVTAHEHYAIKAIKASALDYLLKPLDIDELKITLQKIVQEKGIPQLEKRKEVFAYNQDVPLLHRQKIALPTTDGLIFTSQDEIVQCHAEGNYTYCTLKSNEKVFVSKPLSYFEEVLSKDLFCRPHHSYLVNLNYVKKYVKGRGGYLILQDNSKVEVSARMKLDFLDRFIR